MNSTIIVTHWRTGLTGLPVAPLIFFPPNRVISIPKGMVNPLFFTYLTIFYKCLILQLTIGHSVGLP